MSQPIVLASGSEIRAALLKRAGVPFEQNPVALDEAAIIAALTAEACPPDQIADALAEAKARKASTRFGERLVLGCDQVLALGDAVLQKAADRSEARTQLDRLNGATHKLHSAAVLYLAGQPQWRFTGTVRLTMADNSAEFLDDYLERNWDSVRHSVGCYKLEEEGVQLFSRVEGDYFCVLGLPLIELIGYLRVRGVLPT